MPADGQGAGFDPALGASYRLEELLGRGATGEVWRAVDRRTDEPVAAKLLRNEHVADRDLVGRFVRERSILTGLRHPGVVAVRDLVVEGDRLAIVMDLVDGGSLRDVLDEGPLPPALALDVTAAVLDGLAGAHDHGVLHRDVKPDNVLLTREWRELAPGSVRITDFGISRIVADGAGTTTGLLGTPEYMSPELLTTGAADLPADVYGVGVLLYELLAGRTPFAGPGTDYTVAHRHVTVEPPPLPVPPAVWEALSALLAKDPRQRPTAAQAAARLRRLRADDPTLGDLPPLTVQAPEEFAPLARPATVVRGLHVDAPDAGAAAPAEVPAEPDLDLGAPGQQTTVRPMAVPRAARATPVAAPAATTSTARRVPWRDPKVLALVGGGVALVLVAVGFTALRGSSDDAQAAAGAGGSEVSADQGDQPLPTGLTVSREATYDAGSDEARLTITYAAQRAPLLGPYLEVLPGPPGDADSCPVVTWEGAEVKENLASRTGITAPCAWSVDPGPLDAGGSVTVQATVPLQLPGDGSADAALDEWLGSAAEATSTAVGDTAVTGTAYPVQRLTGIDVVAPDRTVSPKALPLTLLPVWPSGADELNPMYSSPSVGEPSLVLQAVAGGEEGVRFTDGCSGALAVSSDGLVVTALRPADDCTVNADVGNLAGLASNPVAIVTRGS